VAGAPSKHTGKAEGNVSGGIDNKTDLKSEALYVNTFITAS
jgi:hypothetical protein